MIYLAVSTDLKAISYSKLSQTVPSQQYRDLHTAMAGKHGANLPCICPLKLLVSSPQEFFP
jgi:hypothetical protein